MADANFFIDRISIVQGQLYGAKDIVQTQNPVRDDGKAHEKFNDVETVGQFPDQMFINPIHPIIQIRIRYGEVIDGITVTYKVDNVLGGKVTVSHGSSEKALQNDRTLKEAVIDLNPNEVITAVSGRAGNSGYGDRVTQLEFVIHDSNTGTTRLAGPFGSNEGSTFSITGITALVAFAGNAVDTDKSIGQLSRGELGGLYGLSFINALYRTP